MRQLIAILMVGGLVLTNAAKADDVDDVKAAVQALYETLNKGDADGYAKLVLPGESLFLGGGGLLILGAITVEDIRNNLQALFDSGLKIEVQIHHLDAKVYGNAAGATYYLTGRLTYTGGTILQGIFRGSMIWTKQAGQWKRVHTHNSRLVTEPQ